MKTLKKWSFRLLKVLGVFLALYLIVALVAPASFSIERKKLMNLDKASIYATISSFENWNRWSPWVAKDTTLDNTIEGTDGTVGSKQSWKGDPELSGEGSMTLTSLEENAKVLYDLRFADMDGMVIKGAITINESGDQNEVSWKNEGDIPFIMRPIALFFDMEANMAPDLEQGLNNIDSVAKIMEVEMNTPYVIDEVNFPTSYYYGIKRKMKITDIDSTLFAEAYTQLGMFCGMNSIQLTGMPACFILSWDDEESGECELMPVFQVKRNDISPSNGIMAYTIKETEAVVLDFYGDYDELEDGHFWAGAYIEATGYNCSVGLEVYETDPASVESKDQILTKIYYFKE